MASPGGLVSTRPRLPKHVLEKLEKRYGSSRRASPVQGGDDDAAKNVRARAEAMLEKRMMLEQKALVEARQAADAVVEERNSARVLALQSLQQPGFSRRKYTLSPRVPSPRVAGSTRSERRATTPAQTSTPRSGRNIRGTVAGIRA